MLYFFKSIGMRKYLFVFLIYIKCFFYRFKKNFPGAFEDDEVTHVDGEVNPVRDMETIFEELRLKDAEYLIKTLENLERTVIRGNDKTRRAEYVSFSLVVHCS